ncbi:MAG: phosphotransferase family protein [Microthrixaceae bacterium]
MALQKNQDDSIDAPEITRTTRDHSELREVLQSWMTGLVEDPSISELRAGQRDVLGDRAVRRHLDRRWCRGRGGAGRSTGSGAGCGPGVHPLRPGLTVPRSRGWASTPAPVPRLRWLEEDPSLLGSAFFVMDRVDGEVPPDVMPYPIESFLLDATPEQQKTLQDSTVDVLAEIHSTPIGEETAYLELDEPGDTALRKHVNHWLDYATWVRQGRSIDLLDRTERWLEANWPHAADRRDPALSWGDARIGNVIYRDFRPAAVLDWEMAGVCTGGTGPRMDDVPAHVLPGHHRGALSCPECRTSWIRTTLLRATN